MENIQKRSMENWLKVCISKYNCSYYIIYLVIYDWFERENGNQYKLGLTKQQYDQMKSIVSPRGKFY